MGDRSVSIGRDATGNSIVTGDGNTVTTTVMQSSLPPPESVDIRAELAALRAILEALDPPEPQRMQRGLDDAADEAAKPDPDKDEIGGSLDRALRFAQKADSFADKLAELKPRLEAACSWLGKSWHKLLVGIGV